jgi:esterase/lipase superfamily enzyme
MRLLAESLCFRKQRRHLAIAGDGCRAPGTGQRHVEQGSLPDPTRYFILREIGETNRENFIKQMNEAGADKESSLLLFVHGFNVTFADAALRTAQLAHDLQFPGKVMLYSWPSAGAVGDYWKDEDSSRISTPRFRRLLADLLATRLTRIYVVAHSMGTRIVIPAVTTLASQGVDVSKVSELMLAAADFNVIEFKELAADFEKLRAKGTHLTVYAASNDFALQASRRIHSYRRLGESDPTLSIYAGLDSVDASAAAPMRRAYGHSYVSDSSQVLGDMQDLVLKGLAPKDRGLLPIPNTSHYGWKIPKLD